MTPPEVLVRRADPTDSGKGGWTVRVVPKGSPVANYAFDVTPARLVTGLITERGLLRPERAALASAFPERSAGH